MLMTDTDILSVREQIQEDLLSLLDANNIEDIDYIWEDGSVTPKIELSGLTIEQLSTFMCQIVVDNFTQLLNK